MMNERIRELAIRCSIETGSYEYGSRPEFDYEKFAELIVKECVSIGDNYQDILGDAPECFNCRKVAYGIVDKIKEHFGVE
jgi:hypothetical protein